MCLSQPRAKVLHFFAWANKLAPGMVYHSNPHRGDWEEVASA